MSTVTVEGRQRGGFCSILLQWAGTVSGRNTKTGREGGREGTEGESGGW